MRKPSSVMRLSLSIALVVLVQGCDSAPPAPSPVRQPAPELPASPLPGTTRVTGLVVEPGGQAVPGAVITRMYGGLPTTTVTGPTGAYELTLDAQPPEIVRLTVEADGFEPSVLYIAAEGKAEARRDLHIHRIVRIAVGESVRLSIGQDDSFCSARATDWDYDANARPCRRIRVVSLSEGRLDIWVTEPQYRIHPVAGPHVGGGPYLSVPVDAGSETIVDLVLTDTLGQFVAVLETRLSGWWDY